VSAPVLETRGLAKSFGGVQAVAGVDLAMPRGEIRALIGPNGAGKTTFFNMLTGQLKADAGEVRFKGERLSGLPPHAVWRLGVSRTFQITATFSSLTALENVAVPLELGGEPDALERARALLGDVGLGERAHHYPVQLSGGEQQRVAVARAVARRPMLLLADEPTGNLDSATGKQIIDLLLALNRNLGSTLVLVTHDPALAALADRVIMLRDGRIVADDMTNGSGG